MSDLLWLTQAQMARLEPFFPKSLGYPRFDDRRVLSGIIFINRNGLRWRDAPREYCPPKTLCNRWKRWGDKGIFARMLVGLAAKVAVLKTVMIDATYLKVHRTATSLQSKSGAWRPSGPPDRPHNGRDEHQTACHHRRRRSLDPVLRDRRPGQRLNRSGCASEQSALS